MKPLQLLALEALHATAIEAIIASGEENHFKLDSAIRSACTHVEHLPQFPCDFTTVQCFNAFKEFTVSEINEPFYTGEVSSTLTGMKRNLPQFVVDDIWGMTVFRSLAGRRLVVKLAEDSVKVKVPTAHRPFTGHWGWTTFAMYVLDLRAVAELAKTSFAFHNGHVSVHLADIERAMPIFLNGNTRQLTLKRKRAPGGSGI